MNISYKQLLWLDQQGGRTLMDVLNDEEGLYVLMWNGKEKKYDRICLPDNDSLQIHYAGIIEGVQFY